MIFATIATRLLQLTPYEPLKSDTSDLNVCISILFEIELIFGADQRNVKMKTIWPIAICFSSSILLARLAFPRLSPASINTVKVCERPESLERD